VLEARSICPLEVLMKTSPEEDTKDPAILPEAIVAEGLEAF
jgi:hypothetical protein